MQGARDSRAPPSARAPETTIVPTGAVGPNAHQRARLALVGVAFEVQDRAVGRPAVRVCVATRADRREPALGDVVDHEPRVLVVTGRGREHVLAVGRHA